MGWELRTVAVAKKNKKLTILSGLLNILCEGVTQKMDRPAASLVGKTCKKPDSRVSISDSDRSDRRISRANNSPDPNRSRFIVKWIMIFSAAFFGSYLSQRININRNARLVT